MKKKQIEIGDIFEIKLKKGKAYFQCVKIPEDKTEVELIRVFYKIYKERPEQASDILKGEGFFFIRFALRYAFSMNIFERIENLQLEDDLIIPSIFRTENPFGKGWVIEDIEADKYLHVGLTVLSDEQIKISPAGVWNDTLLIEKLENGWRLENWTDWE